MKRRRTMLCFLLSGMMLLGSVTAVSAGSSSRTGSYLKVSGTCTTTSGTGKVTNRNTGVSRYARVWQLLQNESGVTISRKTSEGAITTGSRNVSASGLSGVKKNVISAQIYSGSLPSTRLLETLSTTATP